MRRAVGGHGRGEGEAKAAGWSVSACEVALLLSSGWRCGASKSERGAGGMIAGREGGARSSSVGVDVVGWLPMMRGTGMGRSMVKGTGTGMGMACCCCDMVWV